MRNFTVFFIFFCVIFVQALGAFFMHRIKRLRLLHDARILALPSGSSGAPRREAAKPLAHRRETERMARALRKTRTPEE
ncbi:MAG: hypothetical protein LBC99_06295 [Spirochaetota bacterium]|nr:hypothetical protein [Spirochaetota bacterium]